MTDTRCEFTLRHYREIIERAIERGFTFLQLRQTNPPLPKGKLIVLRHDIDFSVDDAHRMAVLEHELGAVATYCVLLHSPCYSVGEPATMRKLVKILGLGHEIALHYDASFYEEFGVKTRKGVEMEADLLGRLLRTRIRTVAQHRPRRDGRVRVAGGGFVDAYGGRIMRNFKYLSDSRKEWRRGCVHKHLDKLDRLQLLIHAEWWEAEGDMSRGGTIKRLVASRQAEIAGTMEAYAKSMKTRRRRPRSGSGH